VSAKAKAATLLGLVLLVVVLTREFLPRTVKGPPPVPMIVTVRDTVRNTMYVRAPRRVTTDTVQLVIRETVHDTSYVNVGPTPAERTNIWPVVGLEVGRKVGDTTTVSTFSLRTAQGSVARVYTAGPLLGIWADSSPTPRLLFGPPPQPARVSFWTKVKWGGIGYGGCAVVGGLTRLLGQ
jgi:hypothetical protein